MACTVTLARSSARNVRSRAKDTTASQVFFGSTVAASFTRMERPMKKMALCRPVVPANAFATRSRVRHWQTPQGQ